MPLDDKLTEEEVGLLFQSHLPKIKEYCYANDIYGGDFYAVAEVHRLHLMHENGFAASPEEMIGFLSMMPSAIDSIVASEEESPEFADALARMVDDFEYAGFVFEMYDLEIRPYLLKSAE